MEYDYRKRKVYTTPDEKRTLEASRDLLFEILRMTGCESPLVTAAYQHLSILLSRFNHNGHSGKRTHGVK